MMTSKERILTTLKFGETDRLCFSPLADGYFVAGLPKQGFQYDLIQALDYVGCDIIERHSPCYREVFDDTVKVETKEVNGRYETHYTTPVGHISNCFYFENGAMYTKKHLLEEAEDFQVMTYIARHTDYELLPELFAERQRLIGDRGIPTPTAPCSPLLETLQVLCGLENTTYMLLDEPEIVEEMFEALHERNKKVYRLLCNLDSPVVFAYEDTSTTLISRAWLNEYALPALNDYADILHNGGKMYITHMCGKLSGFKTDLAAQLKSDGIDSVCPPTTGDLPIWEARKAFPNKLLLGGIEPPSLVTVPEKQILAYVEEIIERMPTKKGFILSTGDAVPHGTSIHTLKAIADLVKSLGADSLKLGKE